MSNIVNPEERDPLAQQADRPRPSLAVRRTIPSGALPAVPGIPTPTDPITDMTANEVLPGGLPPGTREEVLQGLVPPAPEETAAIEAGQQADPSIAPDWILPSVNEQPGPIPGIPRLRLRPINYENPVVPSIEFEDDDAAMERIRRQAIDEGVSNDIIHSNAIRERIARANFTSRDSGYAQPRTYIELSQEASALGVSAENRRQEAMRPQALDPNQGMLGVGRNVLSGRPFSRISEQVMGDHFSRIAEDGQYQTPLGRWIRTNVQNRWLQRGALAVSSLGRFDQYLQDIGGDIRQAEVQLQADDPNYRTLAQRVGSEVRRFLTTPLPLYASGNDRPTTFRSTTDRAPLVEMLGRESPAFRQLMTELGPSLDVRRQAQVNPLRGEFGEFGSAGTFSAAMYLLNLRGGTLTGAIYDAAGIARDALARVNPTWARPAGSITTASALLGRDSGFTNTYTPDRYLSTIGNPALGWLPRRGQIALGFALDILADPDGLASSATRRLTQQAARATARNAADGLAAALDDLIAATGLPDPSFVAMLSHTPSVVRSTDTGVRSVATDAVLPTVLPGNTVNPDPVVVATPPTRRRPGGNIYSVDDLLNRVERVLAELGDVNLNAFDVDRAFARPIVEESNDAYTRGLQRQTPAGQMMQRIDRGVRETGAAGDLSAFPMNREFIDPMLREADANYYVAAHSMVREAHIIARGLRPEDFPVMAQGLLARLTRNGVNVSDNGAITLYNSNPLLNALVAPVRMANAAPLYRNYSDILDMYRTAPTALPGTALELVRRSDQEIVDLAKMWGVLPHDATASSFRVAQLRATNPEFGGQWGTAIDPNVSQPIRRIVEMDGSSVLDTPELSRMVASPPSNSVQGVAPDDIQTVLGNLQRKYADEVVRYSNASSPSTQNRITQRLAQIRQEGAKLIADFPEEAATFVARQQPDVQRYPNLIEPAREVAKLDMLMRQNHSVLDDLNKQLGIIANRVKEQQDTLALMPPLERRFVDTELDTRRMSGEEPIIRSVATPTSMSNETEYPAAFKELAADDALLPSNHGIANSVAEIIAKGELGTLPEDEALDYIRNLVDKKVLQAFDGEDMEVIGQEITLDSLLTYNDYVSDLRNAIDGIPAYAKYTSNHDLEVAVPNKVDGGLHPARIIARADVLDAMMEAARHNEVRFDHLRYTFKVTEVPYGARWLGGGAYGNAYLMPDGTVLKRGKIPDNEVRLQAKAAAQGVAPAPVKRAAPSLPNTKVVDENGNPKPVYHGSDSSFKELDPAYSADNNLFTKGVYTTESPTVGAQYKEKRTTESGNVEPTVYETYLDIRNPLDMDAPADIDEWATELEQFVDPRTGERPYAGEFTLPEDPDRVLTAREFIMAGDHATNEDAFYAVGALIADNLPDNSLYAEGITSVVKNMGYDGVTHIGGGRIDPNSERHRVWIAFKREQIHMVSANDVPLDYRSPDNPAVREFTMQFLDGYRTFKSTMDNLTGAELATVHKQVFETIDKLHRAGVVHNDIHTENIMVNPETLDVKIIDFGLASDAPATVAGRSGRDVMDDYDFIASQLGKEVVYHGTHHTSWVDGYVYSLSNELGPGLYVTRHLDTAIDYAKAYPAQDVVTTSTRIPRREQQGNVTAFVILDDIGIRTAIEHRDKIFSAFTEALEYASDTRILTNFKKWSRNNTNPEHWWHYIRSKFVGDDGLVELANIQLQIRELLVDDNVRAIRLQGGRGYVILDESIIEHRSIPHYVESTGSVAEALLYRNKVDDNLAAKLDNSTTRAIQAHNRLNVDTYLQNQATAAVTKEQQLLLEQMDNLHRQQLSLDTEMLASRQSTAAQLVADMERKTNAVINYEVRNINDLCL